MEATAVTISHQALSAETRSEPGKVTGKLKAALDLVVFEGLDPYDAAAKVEYHARSMRLALQRPHVLAYLRQQREVLRATASAQNIHHAIEMRAQSGNAMARLGAMKFIEGIDDIQQSGAAARQMPGFVIQIVNQPAAAPLMAQERVINAKPLIDHDLSSDDAGGEP